MGEFLSFAVVSVAVIVTPGPDTALTVRNTLLGGRVGGVYTAVGVSAGQAAWTLATSAGLNAVLVASAPVFAALKLAGDAYLVFLGARAVFGALRSHDGKAMAAPEPVSARLSPAGALRQGLISNLGNPEDPGFLHRHAAPVRGLVRRADRLRRCLVFADPRVVDRLQLRRRQGERAPAQASRTAVG